MNIKENNYLRNLSVSGVNHLNDIHNLSFNLGITTSNMYDLQKLHYKIKRTLICGLKNRTVFKNGYAGNK